MEKKMSSLLKKNKLVVAITVTLCVPIIMVAESLVYFFFGLDPHLGVYLVLGIVLTLAGGAFWEAIIDGFGIE